MTTPFPAGVPAAATPAAAPAASPTSSSTPTAEPAPAAQAPMVGVPLVWSAAGVPTNLLALYGPLKCGKTMGSIMACPTALFVAAGEAVAPVARYELGLEVVGLDFRSLPEMVLTLEAWEADGSLRRFGGVCIDDASVRLSDAVTVWRSEPEAAKNRYYPFNMLDLWMGRLRSCMARANIVAILSFHERGPIEANNVVQEKGGVYVPSAGKTDVIPAICSSVWHVEDDAASLDPWWKKCLMGSGMDARWSASCRYGVTSPRNPRIPFNIREGFGAVGIQLPRFPGLEWQEQWAAYVAASLDGGAAVQEVGREVRGTLRALDERHVRWAIQDGIARHAIRAKRLSPLDVFDAAKLAAANVVLPGSAPPLPGAPAGGPAGAPAGGPAASSSATPPASSSSPAAGPAPSGASAPLHPPGGPLIVPPVTPR